MPLETVLLATADGLVLDGDLLLPDHPWGAAVVAHPHPQYGGDRRNVVVQALAQALHDAGVATVRFDFRGVGASEGSFDEGQGERLDVAAAIDAAAPFAGDGPVLVAGYSFGAMVALDVAHPRADGWLAVAPPLAMAATAPLAAADHRPKLLVVPEHDQFSPPAVVTDRTATWRATTVVTLAMTDHFLGGQARAAGEHAVAFIRSLAP